MRRFEWCLHLSWSWESEWLAGSLVDTTTETECGIDTSQLMQVNGLEAFRYSNCEGPCTRGRHVVCSGEDQSNFLYVDAAHPPALSDHRELLNSFNGADAIARECVQMVVYD